MKLKKKIIYKFMQNHNSMMLTLLFIVLVLCLLTRFVFLDLRPPHFDEGVNGWFVNQMYKLGYYKYDPANYHGPLYFYMLQFFESIFSGSLTVHRSLSAVFGTMSVFLIIQFRLFFSKAAWVAGFLLILSPAYWFYNRYSIHESLFTFFIILAVYGYFLWQDRKYKLAAWYIVFSVTAALCLKETAIVHIFCFFLSFLIMSIYSFIKGKKIIYKFSWEKLQFFSWPIVFSLGFWFLLYSGFGKNMSGLVDFFRAFDLWRAVGEGNSGHNKVFYYWLDLLRTYEPLLLLSLVGSFFYFAKQELKVKIFYLYTWLIWLFFSILSYKTPWNILPMLWPLALVFGTMLNSFVGKKRKIFYAITSVLILWTIFYGVRLNFLRYEDPKEKYIYVQTRKCLIEVLSPLLESAKKDPQRYYLKIGVLISSYWPLPWLLENFKYVDYYSKSLPEKIYYDVIITDADKTELLQAKLEGKFWSRPFLFRSSQKPAQIFYKKTYFDLSEKGYQLLP